MTFSAILYDCVRFRSGITKKTQIQNPERERENGSGGAGIEQVQFYVPCWPQHCRLWVSASISMLALRLGRKAGEIRIPSPRIAVAKSQQSPRPLAFPTSSFQVRWQTHVEQPATNDTASVQSLKASVEARLANAPSLSDFMAGSSTVTVDSTSGTPSHIPYAQNSFNGLLFW